VKNLIGVKRNYLVICLFISNCAGSPRITITKNVSVVNSCEVDVEYTTESSTENVADIVQDLKDLIKVTPKP